MSTSATKLEIIRGGDYTIPIQVNDADGDAINITGQTLFFTVKHTAIDDDDDALISKDITTHAAPTSGQSTLILSGTDTDINPGRYVYDFKRQSGSASIPYTGGEFVVSSSITQRDS